VGGEIRGWGRGTPGAGDGGPRGAHRDARLGERRRGEAMWWTPTIESYRVVGIYIGQGCIAFNKILQ
jgi:hypothetical protein